MAIEYNAIALVLAALMFFLMEFAAKINFITAGTSFINMNDWAKFFFIASSMGMGLALVVFGYAVGDGNAEVIKQTMLSVMYFWVTMILAFFTFFVIYILFIVPKVADQIADQMKGR